MLMQATIRLQVWVLRASLAGIFGGILKRAVKG